MYFIFKQIVKAFLTINPAPPFKANSAPTPAVAIHTAPPVPTETNDPTTAQAIEEAEACRRFAANKKMDISHLGLFDQQGRLLYSLKNLPASEQPYKNAYIDDLNEATNDLYRCLYSLPNQNDGSSIDTFSQTKPKN